MRISLRGGSWLAVVSLMAACGGGTSSRPAAAPPQPYPPPYATGPQPYPPPYASATPGGYPPPGYPPPGTYPPPAGYPPAAGTAPPPGPAPAATAPVASRPLLPPLVGPAAWQAEVRSVLAELIDHLQPANASKVRGIPLQVDPDPMEVNAYAGCDPQGKPFLAATEGLLEAMDAIAQTRATDELYGTHTYDAYTQAVIPGMLQPKGGSAALPLGIVPVQYVMVPQRLSHAHELFDDLVAFTFGHELAHHYLGHTGCAIGESPLVQGLAIIGHIGSAVAPVFNQPAEYAADDVGLFDVMDTGRARRPAYEYTEKGGLLLLDFFARMEAAAGGGVLTEFSRSHPPSRDRITWVQGFAAAWRAQHGT